MHLQFAAERRLRAKQALYKINEILRWPERRTVAEVNAMYDQTTTPAAPEFGPAPESWWYGLGHLRSLIDLDAEPWQEAEVKRLVAEHGAFAGLDLYGVA